MPRKLPSFVKPMAESSSLVSSSTSTTVVKTVETLPLAAASATQKQSSPKQKAEAKAKKHKKHSPKKAKRRKAKKRKLEEDMEDGGPDAYYSADDDYDPADDLGDLKGFVVRADVKQTGLISSGDDEPEWDSVEERAEMQDIIDGMNGSTVTTRRRKRSTANYGDTRDSSGMPKAKRQSRAGVRTVLKTLPLCRYGKKCYRKNPTHFEEFNHPWNPLKGHKI